MKKLFIFFTVIFNLLFANNDFFKKNDIFIALEYGNTSLVENIYIDNNLFSSDFENRFYSIKAGTIFDFNHRFYFSSSSYESNINDSINTNSISYDYLFDLDFFNLYALIGTKSSFVNYNIDYGFYDIEASGLNLLANFGIAYNVDKFLGWEVGFRKSFFNYVENQKIINNKNFQLSLDKFDQLYFSININLSKIF